MPESTDSAKDNDSPTTQAPPPVIGIERQPETKPSCDERCQEADQRDKDDLIAQQSMARSTKQLVDQGLTLIDQGIGHIVIGIGGLLAILITLGLTYRATNQAIEANRIARNTAKMELRAYLGVAVARMHRFDKDGPYVAIRFQNSGNTPAKNVVSVLMGEARKVDSDAPFVISKNASPQQMGAINPGADYTAFLYLDEMGPIQRNGIAVGYLGVFAFGRVDYIDIFGNEQWATFRLIFGADSLRDPDHRLGICEEGNDAS